MCVGAWLCGFKILCVWKLAGSTSNLEGDCCDHLIITFGNSGGKYFGFLSAESELNYAIFTVKFGDFKLNYA